MEKPPCKDCADRYLGCHSKCEKYIDWNKRWQENKDTRQDKLSTEFAVRDMNRNRKRSFGKYGRV